MPTIKEASLQEMAGDSRIESERSRPGEPDGIIFGVDPESVGETREEREAFVRRLLQDDEGEMIPRAPIFQRAPAATQERPVPEGRQAPASAADPELFDPDAALYDLDEYRVEEYRMPNGKKVWVHPISLDEKRDINKQVLADLRARGFLKPAEDAEQQEIRDQERSLEALFLAQVYQVLRCARQGPDPEAKPVFKDRHLPALRGNAGWAQVIEDLAARSDALANGKTEALYLKEMLRDFFGAVQSSVATCCSRLRRDFSDEQSPPPGVRDALSFLEDFGASVSALRQPGKPWGNRELQALALVLGLPPEEEGAG